MEGGRMKELIVAGVAVILLISLYALTLGLCKAMGKEEPKPGRGFDERGLF